MGCIYLTDPKYHMCNGLVCFHRQKDEQTNQHVVWRICQRVKEVRRTRRDPPVVRLTLLRSQASGHHHRLPPRGNAPAEPAARARPEQKRRSPTCLAVPFHAIYLLLLPVDSMSRLSRISLPLFSFFFHPGEKNYRLI